MTQTALHPRFAALLSALSVLMLPSCASGQDAGTPHMSKSQVETSISLGAAAQLTATRVSSNSYSNSSQGLDPSPAILGSIRQSVRPWLGYSANFGYTRTTEQNNGILYYYPYSPPSTFAIPVNVYELSLAYALQKHVTPKVTGFTNLGAGVLTFLPVHRGATAANYVPNGNHALVPSVLFRQLGVAAVGVEYRYNARLGVRAEYRGLLYKYPDFGSIVGRAITVSSQPTVSLIYHLGPKR